MKTKTLLAKLLFFVIIVNLFVGIVFAHDDSQQYTTFDCRLECLDINDIGQAPPPDDFTLVTPSLLHPISVQEFLNSEASSSLSIKERNELEEAFEVFKEQIELEECSSTTFYFNDFSELRFHFEITEVSFDTDAEIEVYFFPEGEGLPQRFLVSDNEYLEQRYLEAEFAEQCDVIPMSFVDIFLRNLSVNAVGTLQIDRLYNFSFDIGNTGSSNASNVNVDVHLGNDFLGTLAFGTIPAWAQGTANFDFGIFGGNLGGTRVMRLTGQTSSSETNTANNVTQRTFVWEQIVDLQTHNLANLTSGDRAFETFTNQEFGAIVVNLGSVACMSSRLNVFADGAFLGSINLPRLDPGYMVQPIWGLSWRGSGASTMRAEAQTTCSRHDARPNNNNISRTFIVLPDGCGRWTRRLVGDTRNITISILSPEITVSQLSAAANQWNGITSHINITTIGHNLNSPTAWVEVFLMPDDVGGWFQPNTMWGNFSGGWIDLNETYFNQGNAWYDRYLLGHEIGHLIGLGHPHESSNGMGGNPQCIDFAIMQYPNLWTDHVTSHDRAALRKQYGNW